MHKKGGASYFRLSTGFSINEGVFPNIHIGWRDWPRLYVYVALSRRLKWHNGTGITIAEFLNEPKKAK